MNMSTSLYNPMVQFIHRAYCIAPAYLERTDISLLPSGLIKQVAERLKPRIGECYYNAARLALELSSRGINATYVVGVANVPGALPAGHGWIEIDGSSYDSTLELGAGTLATDYFAIERYEYEELFEFICNNDNIPPCFPDHISQDKRDYYWRTGHRNEEVCNLRSSA